MVGIEQGKNNSSEGCFPRHKGATCKLSCPEHAHSSFSASQVNIQWLQLSLLLKAEPKQPSCLLSSWWWSMFGYKVVQHCLVPHPQGNRLFPALNNAVEEKMKRWDGSQKQTKQMERKQHQRGSERQWFTLH